MLAINKEEHGGGAQSIIIFYIIHVFMSVSNLW